MKKDNTKFSEILKLAKTIRKRILYTAFHAKENSSHFGGSLSNVEIISVLFSKFLNMKPTLNNTNDRHRFILSKGHGCLAYYAALCEYGFINEKDLENFENNNSPLLGHPVKNKIIGIDFSTGSLGMGLGLGIGVAISLKKLNIEKKVYVLMGDGECNEGSVWEAGMSAAKFKLNNLVAIIDRNNFQQTGSNEEIMTNLNLKDKWKSFNWEVIEIDGHNISELYQAFSTNSSDKPIMIIANTIKGKGFDFSENNNDWHHQVLTKIKYEEALRQLK